MNIVDAMTLQAFSLARLRLNGSLPKDLEATVHQVGHAIAQHEPGVADTVRDLVQQQGCLREPYEEAYSLLSQHYQPRVQSMRAAMGAAIAPSIPIEDSWEEVVAQILTAENPKSIVKQVVYQAQTHPEFRVHGNLPPAYLASLQKELTNLDQEAIAVLQILERQLLSVEDLAYTLQLPLEQTRRIVEELWNDGYIDCTKSNLFHRLVHSFRESACKHEVTDPRMHFIITPKGHFYLHPLVKHRRAERSAT